MTRKVKLDPNMLRVQYLENSWSCYLAIIANYYSLLCGSRDSYPSDSLASCLNVDLTGRLAFVVILTLVV